MNIKFEQFITVATWVTGGIVVLVFVAAVVLVGYAFYKIGSN